MQIFQRLLFLHYRILQEKLVQKPMTPRRLLNKLHGLHIYWFTPILYHIILSKSYSTPGIIQNGLSIGEHPILKSWEWGGWLDSNLQR